MNKFLKIILAIIVVALCVFVVAFIIRSKKTTTVTNQSEQKAFTVADFDSSRVPTLIPTDFPFEAGAMVIKNYNSTSDDGSRITGVRIFEGKQKIEDAFNKYSKYFKDSGFTVLSTVNQPSIKLLLGKKDDLFLKTEITTQSAGGTRVEVTAYKNVEVQ